MNETERLAETRRWLRYAQEDLEAAETLLQQQTVVPRHICWLAQQAAEKAIKAILVFLEIDSPWRHDLDALRNLIPAGWQVKDEHPDLAGLTEWAVEAGILSAKAGKVRLLRRDELPSDWDPTKDGRLTAWETTQHLIRVLEKDGESGAAQLLAKLGATGELARDLAYRLYTTCERKKWAQDALAFNSLVVSWPEIVRLAAQKPAQQKEEMF